MADSIEDEVAYLQSLGVTADDLDALNTDIRHTEFAIAQSVFSGISEDKPSATVPVVLGSTTVQLTIRRNLSDNDWWIDEDDGSDKEHTLFGLHKFAHYEKSYTYIIVSPYEWDNEDIKKQLLCISNASLLIRYN